MHPQTILNNNVYEGFQFRRCLVLSRVFTPQLMRIISECVVGKRENASSQHFYTIRGDTAEPSPWWKKVCMLIRSCLARSRFCNNFVLVFSLTQHKCLHYLRYCRRCLFRETGKIFLIGTIFLEEVKKYFLFIGDQAAKLFLTAWHFLWCR